MKINVPCLGVLIGALLALAGCTGKVDGQSPTCGAGQRACGLECKTVATDQQNCGACGNACSAGQTCQNGQCLCSSGLLACNGSCVSATAAHCGGCTTMCPTGQVCSANVCQASCATGETQCSDGACVPANGGDALHCGGCNACPPGAVCNAGICGCSIAGQMLCSNSCVDTSTSSLHCGGCNQPCNGTCTNGICASATGTGGAGGATGTGGTGGRRAVHRDGADPTAALAALGRAVGRRGQGSSHPHDGAGADRIAAVRRNTPSSAIRRWAWTRSSSSRCTRRRRTSCCPRSRLASRRSPRARGRPPAAQRTCAKTFTQSLGAKGFRRPYERRGHELHDGLRPGGDDRLCDRHQPDRAGRDHRAVVHLSERARPTNLAADASGNYPDTTLNPYEIASQLGFLFLGSLPDPALTAAAADGKLATSAGLNAQIDRLLTLPAVRTNLSNIIIDWFNVRQMFDKAQGHGAAGGAPGGRSRSGRDHRRDLPVDAALRERRVVDQHGTMNNLVTSQKVFLNRRLVALFPGVTFTGAAPTSNTTFVADLAGDAGTTGMITQPGFLWSASDPGQDVDREARQADPRRRRLSGRAAAPDRSGDAAGDERHRLQVAGWHDLAVDVRHRNPGIGRAHDVRAVQDLPRADGPLLARAPELRPDR